MVDVALVCAVGVLWERGVTDQSNWVTGVITRAMTAIGSASAGIGFVWRAWMGGANDDATVVVMYGLTGFMLILTALHVAVRGFGEPMPTQSQGGGDCSSTILP